jgi:hypothetical protein
LVISLILAFVFSVFVPGWLFFIVPVILIGFYGAAMQIRTEMMLSSSKGNSSENSLGISMFSEVGQVMRLKSFQIFQVLSDGNALAFSSEKAPAQSIIDYKGPSVLLLTDGRVSYYDSLVITVPEYKVVRQVGTFRYNSKYGIKTVPIVSFFYK